MVEGADRLEIMRSARLAGYNIINATNPNNVRLAELACPLRKPSGEWEPYHHANGYASPLVWFFTA